MCGAMRRMGGFEVSVKMLFRHRALDCHERGFVISSTLMLPSFSLSYTSYMTFAICGYSSLLSCSSP